MGVVLSRLPYRAYFVIGQDPFADARRVLARSHAPDNGRAPNIVRVSCQWKMRRNTSSVTSAILDPEPLSILSSSRTMSERLTVSIDIAPSAG